MSQSAQKIVKKSPNKLKQNTKKNRYQKSCPKNAPKKANFHFELPEKLEFHHIQHLLERRCLKIAVNRKSLAEAIYFADRN